MGYLDGSTIFVDAILTKKGREKLAMGQSLDITKFALSDDEIDYSLYEPAHPKGSAFYDALIKAIPIMEASPDETQVLKYKLVTLPKGTTQIPIVSIGVSSINTSQRGGSIAITPSTSPTGNTSAGYTLILADSSAGSISVTQSSAQTASSVPYMNNEITATAQVVSGLTFSFTPNRNLRQAVSTTLTVYGNETGGSITIPVIVTYRSFDSAQTTQSSTSGGTPPSS